MVFCGLVEEVTGGSVEHEAVASRMLLRACSAGDAQRMFGAPEQTPNDISQFLLSALTEAGELLYSNLNW